MLANIYRNFDWDWTASGAEVRQALEVDPTNPTALMRGGQLSYTLGHWDEAERQLRLALVRDPLATIAIWSLGTAPVSYTHLDVYKRQAQHRAGGLARPTGI